MALSPLSEPSAASSDAAAVSSAASLDMPPQKGRSDQHTRHSHATQRADSEEEWEEEREERQSGRQTVNGYQSGSVQPTTQVHDDDDDEWDSDEDDNSGWHVAIVPAGLSSSSASHLPSHHSAALRSLTALSSVAFSAIKKNIVSDTHTTDTPRGAPTTQSDAPLRLSLSLTAADCCRALLCLVQCLLCRGLSVCLSRYVCQVPGLVLQSFAVFLLILYYTSPAVAAAFQSVANIKEQYGYLFSGVSTSVAAGFIPWLVIVAQQHRHTLSSTSSHSLPPAQRYHSERCTVISLDDAMGRE